MVFGLGTNTKKAPAISHGGSAEEDPFELIISFLTYGKYGHVMKPLCFLGRALHMGSGMNLDFDAYSLVNLVTTAYGGGIVAPLALGNRPAPLVLDVITAVSLLALFLYTSTDFKKLYELAPFKIVGLFLEAMFRINLIAGFVRSCSLPSRVGPIVVGTVAGVGGMFFPFSKGINALKPPLKPPIFRVFATSAFVAIASNPQKYGLEGLDALDNASTTAFLVALNAAFDIFTYLSTSFLFEQQPPPKKSHSSSSTTLFVASLLAVAAGSAGFAYSEENLDALDATYLSVCTLSTVGCGTPLETPQGELVAALLALFGVALFGLAASKAYQTSVAASLSLLLSAAFVVNQLEESWTIQDSALFTFSFATTVGAQGDFKPQDETKMAMILFSFVAKPAFLSVSSALLKSIFRIQLQEEPKPKRKAE